MAYIVKTPSGYSVNQGNTGKPLSYFRGANAHSKAKEEVKRLHEKNNPKQSNRGDSARRKNK